MVFPEPSYSGLAGGGGAIRVLRHQADVEKLVLAIAQTIEEKKSYVVS